jgi:hypothetical protein
MVFSNFAQNVIGLLDPALSYPINRQPKEKDAERKIQRPSTAVAAGLEHDLPLGAIYPVQPTEPICSA